MNNFSKVIHRFPRLIFAVLCIVPALPALLCAEQSVNLTVSSESITAACGGNSTAIPLTNIKLIFDEQTVVLSENLTISQKKLLAGELIDVKIKYPDKIKFGSLDIVLHLQWSDQEKILRKWISYRLHGEQAVLLKEIVFDERKLDLQKINQSISIHEVQSYPVFGKGYFCGIEYPVASTHTSGSAAIIGHLVGEELLPDQWYQSRKIIYGITNPGKELEQFKRYIHQNRPEPKSLHFNYNSWWTTSWAYSQKDILGLLQVFEEKLYQPYSISPDSFAIDLGWSEPNSIWGINKKRFPGGFENISKAADKAGTKLGVWFSPSAYYTEYGALDTAWAKEQGYEYYSKTLCLGGKKYFSQLKKTLNRHIRLYDIAHLKVDGLNLTCPQTSHGHPPGKLSAAHIGKNAVELFSSFRETKPDIWIEATCFGWNPSPWWLFYVNCVLGTHGDDAPWGIVPSPIYRYSLTTARDYFNLQGAVHSKIPIPAQQVFGIIHQSDETFIEDGINAVMRGHNFIPLYFNPKYMNDKRWKTLADLMKWAKNNSEILNKTEILLPESWRQGNTPRFKRDEKMPREVYGYAHWHNNKGLVHLRNPWIKQQDYEFIIRCRGDNLDVTSIFPEQRSYAEKLKKADKLTVTLRPYETLVLSVKEAENNNFPSASQFAEQIQIKAKNTKAEIIKYEEPKKELSKNGAVPDKPENSCVKLEFSAQLNIPYDNAMLYLLLEDEKTKPSAPENVLTLNGHSQSMNINTSNTGFAATKEGPENWLFLEAKLFKGKNDIYLELPNGCSFDRLSLWVWAFRKPVSDNKLGLKSKIAQPEIISLESECLLLPKDIWEKAVISVRKDNIQRQH